MARTFDRPTLDLLDRALEVDIETMRPDGMPRRTTIWLMVDGPDVFVRSVRGERGHWYQAARESPDDVTLHVDGRSVPVRVVSTSDEVSINRCSRALAQKYGTGDSTSSMLRDVVLGTTLRLE